MAKGKGKGFSKMEKLLLGCAVVTYSMWARSSRSPLFKVFRTWSDAGVEHRKRQKPLCMLTKTWRQLLKEPLAERDFKEKSGEAAVVGWIWIQAKPIVCEEQGQLLWQVTWSGVTVLSPCWPEISHDLADVIKWMFLSTWLQLLWKYQAAVSGVNVEFCSSLLQIIIFPVPVTGNLPEKT